MRDSLLLHALEDLAWFRSAARPASGTAWRRSRTTCLDRRSGSDPIAQSDWGDAAAPGTKLEVEVRDPATTHTVILQQLQRWYDGAGSPHEVLKKRNVKELLA